MITMITWSPFIQENISNEGLTLNFKTMDELEALVATKFPRDNEFYPLGRIKRPGRGWGFFDVAYREEGGYGPAVVFSTEDDIEWED